MTECAVFPERIAFIGFGEAAEAFTLGWGRAIATHCHGFDIKYESPDLAVQPEDRADRAGVALKSDRQAALAGAGAVFCLVTADRAVEAAEQAAPWLEAGTFWFDGNSCSPGSKRQAATLIEAAGGRYVDLAIMAPVHPKLHRTPLLIAGPHAEAAAPILGALGMEARIAGDTVGDASSIKMIRSVMVKGLEALAAECLLAARRAGVEGQIMTSLQSSHPGWDWPRQTAYNLERMMVHGRRRAAEMQEVAATLAELGLPHGLTSATVEWQSRIGDLELAPGEDVFGPRADAILQRLGVI